MQTQQYTQEELKLLHAAIFDGINNASYNYRNFAKQLSELLRNTDGIRFHKKISNHIKYLKCSNVAFGTIDVDLFKKVRDLLFHLPAKELPLHINNTAALDRTIVRWRLKIGH